LGVFLWARYPCKTSATPPSKSGRILVYSEMMLAALRSSRRGDTQGAGAREREKEREGERGRESARERERERWSWDPLSSECGTHTTVTVRFWPWRSGESRANIKLFHLLSEASYPEYSRANSYPWSPFPPDGPVQDPVLTGGVPREREEDGVWRRETERAKRRVRKGGKDTYRKKNRILPVLLTKGG